MARAICSCKHLQYVQSEPGHGQRAETAWKDKVGVAACAIAGRAQDGGWNAYDCLVERSYSAGRCFGGSPADIKKLPWLATRIAQGRRRAGSHASLVPGSSVNRGVRGRTHPSPRSITSSSEHRHGDRTKGHVSGALPGSVRASAVLARARAIVSASKRRPLALQCWRPGSTARACG